MMIPIWEEVFQMTKGDQREIHRKLRILEHARQTGQVSRTCRYFGIGRANFYRWKRAFDRNGEDGLANAKPIPKTSPEVEDKVLHLRRTYHSALSASCGIWRAITRLECRMRPSTASLNAMASTVCRAVRGCAKSIQNNITSKCLATTSKWM